MHFAFSRLQLEGSLQILLSSGQIFFGRMFFSLVTSGQYYWKGVWRFYSFRDNILGRELAVYSFRDSILGRELADSSLFGTVFLEGCLQSTLFGVSPFFQVTKQHLNKKSNGEKWDVEYLCAFRWAALVLNGRVVLGGGRWRGEDPDPPPCSHSTELWTLGPTCSLYYFSQVTSVTVYF